MNENEKKRNYEEMRRGEALQTLLASPGGKILMSMLLNQYESSLNKLMGDDLSDSTKHIIRMKVIDKLIKDMKGEVNFGELAKKRLSQYQNKHGV